MAAEDRPISDIILQFTYAGIVLALLLRGIGVPLPEDIPLLIGGALCAQGVVEPAVLLPVIFVVVLVSDSISYGLGRRFGHHIPRVPLLGRMLTERRLNRVEEAYHAHGKKTIFVSRFIPALRTPFFFAAGAVRIPFWRFLLVDAAAALLSVSLLVGLGWAFAHNLEEVMAAVAQGKWILLAALAVLVVAVVMVRRHRRRRAQADPDGDGMSAPNRRADAP